MMRMQKKLIGLTVTCLMSLGLFSAALAQNMHPVEGKYEATATGDAIGTINFQMTLKRDGDKWSGQIVNSPQPMTINKVSVDADNKLSITADTGGTEVTLTAKYDEGKFAGKWTAGDANGTWSGIKQGGAAASAAPAGAVEGTYAAEVTADGQGSMPFTLIVKKDGDKLVTEVKDGGDLNVVGIKVEGDAVTLSATFQGNPFPLPGKRTGSDMSGKWEAGGFSGTWSAKKK